RAPASNRWGSGSPEGVSAAAGRTGAAARLRARVVASQRARAAAWSAASSGGPPGGAGGRWGTFGSWRSTATMMGPGPGPGKIMSVVTFTTDFGTVDGYAGAMKGVVLALAP